MSEDLTISTSINPLQDSYSITATFGNSFFLRSLIMKTLELAATKIAEKFVAERGQEIIAAMDPQAIANLAVANSGAAIAAELKKEGATKTRVVEHVKHEIYQRGVFGGLKKL